MPYTEEMTTSEILLRLASMRNELLQAVNDIEKISKNICYKAEQTENSSEKPNNSTISKMEQVDEPTEITYQNCSDALLKMWMDNVLTDAEYNRIMDKLNNAQRKTEPQKIGYCNECKWFRDKQVCGRCRSKNLYAPKDEPQTDCAWK
jgi:Na+/phosphate symporter